MAISDCYFFQENALKNKKYIEKRKKMLYNEERKQRKGKNMIKKISIFIIILTLILVMFPRSSYASLTDPIINVNEYEPGPNEVSPELISIANTVLGIIQVAGTIISLISTMFIGVKYMMGSTQEKAQYKETMIPYVIGIVLLFTAVNILKPIYNLVVGILN